MLVNLLEARNQFSKLVKAAVSGEEVIIANHGEAQVRLAPCVAAPGLRHWGNWPGSSGMWMPPSTNGWMLKLPRSSTTHETVAQYSDHLEA